MQYSVLMSVYKKEHPAFLRDSIQSMLDQTVPTNDFVLICDGPLTPELDAVIGEFETSHKEIMHVIRFEENHGLGHALQVGVEACKNDVIARMDSDDLSRPTRCEKELACLEAHPEISVVGSVIEEFTTDPAQPERKRVVPETQEEILKFAKRRSPFNHPSVMYRKQDVLDAGNYQEVRFMQDYYLWAAMLIKGYQGYNIQEPLVLMRADNNLFKRRSGKLYRQLQVGLFRYMLDNGFITYPEYVTSCAIRLASAAAPNGLRQFMFKKVLRK